MEQGRENEINHIPAAEFAAPRSIDFSHGRYICIDGLYYAYLLIPSDGYKTQVPAGWLSLIVNAGDGIDMDTAPGPAVASVADQKGRPRDGRNGRITRKAVSYTHLVRPGENPFRYCRAVFPAVPDRVRDFKPGAGAFRLFQLHRSHRCV